MMATREGAAVPKDIVAHLEGGCPIFFQEFQEHFCSSGVARDAAKNLGLCVKMKAKGEWYIENLSHASRQWSFAERVAGFKVSEGISNDRSQQYFGFFKLQLAAAALERFAACFSNPANGKEKKWFDIHHTLYRHSNFPQSYDLRSVLTKTAASKLGREAGQPLKERWGRFISYEDTKQADIELFAIAIVIRNAFAHGEIWGAKQLLPFCVPLAGSILNSIKLYTESLIAR